MRKLIFILSVFIIVSGCSIAKRGIDSSEVTSEVSGNDDIIGSVENQNLTYRNFFIQKAEIDIEKDGESESFIASVKYDISGKYLISIRGRSGIEAARIYITKDTILVNDRINRNLLFGNPVYIEKKFGIPLELLPLVFGDFITDRDKSDGSTHCVGGALDLERIVQGVKMKYVIDCKKRKVKSVIREGIMNSEIAEFGYDKYISYGKGYFPSVIQISYLNSRILIKIVKLEIPWEDNIEFIPGNNYELIELL